MKNSRASKTAIVNRQVPENYRVNNLNGGTSVQTKQCSCCKEEKPITEFYVISSSGKKEKMGVRNQCIQCWDFFNGSKPKQESSASLPGYDAFEEGAIPKVTRYIKKVILEQSSARLPEYDI